jgi:hypothetical protein
MSIGQADFPKQVISLRVMDRFNAMPAPGELPRGLKPARKKHELEEYPAKLERMEGTLVRRNDSFPEIVLLSDEQMLDFAHFAVDPKHPGGVWVDHRPGHNRSFVFSESDISDEAGANLGKLNIKGTGFVSLGGVGPTVEAFKGHHVLPEISRRTLRPKRLGLYEHDASNKGVYGLMSLEDAQADYGNGERLASLGIRTSRGVAIIKLKTIFYPGKGIVRVEDLKRNRAIPDDFEPVIYVRATGADHRIRDYEDPEFFPRSSRSWLKERKALAVASAIERVAREIEKESFTTEEYLRWFAETFGKQVGMLSKRPAGYVHPVDVTLDCRLLDLDNIETLGDVKASLEKYNIEAAKAEGILESGMRADLESAKISLLSLVSSCRDVSVMIGKGEIPSAKGGGARDRFAKELGALFDEAYKQSRVREKISA